MRTKIAVGFGQTMLQATGGKALKYYAAIRTKVTRTQRRDTHICCQATAEKNKVSKPFKTVKFNINFDKGIIVK